MSYAMQKRYIEACLGEEEIQKRIADLPDDARRTSICRWEDNVTRTPQQMRLWAQLAVDLSAEACDAYNIYRPKTPEELRHAVIDAEHYLRMYTTKDLPEDLTDPHAAAAEWRKQQREAS